MAEIGKYGFQIVNVVALRYIDLNCAICYKCVPKFIRKHTKLSKSAFFYETVASDTKELELVYKMNQ